MRANAALAAQGQQPRTRLQVAALLGMVLLPGLALHAQDSQYWTQQQGAQAILLGGAVLTSTVDQSAFYYNPGAVALLPNTGLTASSNYAYMRTTRVRDKNGYGLDMGQFSTDESPKLVAGSVKLKGKEQWRFSFGFLNGLYGKFSMGQQGILRVELDGDPAQKEYMPVVVQRAVSSREDLVGIGAGKQLSDRTGIGVTLFGSFFSQKYLQTMDASGYGEADSTGAHPTIGTWVRSESADLFNFGLTAKFGILHTIGSTPIGFSATLPRINTQLFPSGTYYFSRAGAIQDSTVTKYLVYGDDLPVSYRTPFMLEVGAEHVFGTWTLSGRVMWASGIAAYDRLRVDPAKDLAQGLVGGPGLERRLRSASKPIVNVGMGARWVVSKNVDLLMGARSDLSPIDQQDRRSETDIDGVLSVWNLYHFSFGADVHSKRVSLTVGLEYSYGRKDHSPPDVGSWLPFAPEGIPIDLRYTFSQLGVAFGINFFFFGGVESAGDGSQGTKPVIKE